MKKMPIYARILIPVLIAFLLLPPIVYGVFRMAAQRQARREAEEELSALQEQVMDLADVYLQESTANDPEQVRRFLRGISQLIRNESGNARLLLFAEENSLIYPYMEEERAEVSSLADMIGQKVNDTNDSSFFLVSSRETDYLISSTPSPVSTRRLTTIVTYCPVSGIGAWIMDAGRTVFLLSAAMALLLIVVSVFTARSVTKPMQILCAASERISLQDFSPIHEAFSLREPEALRLSMNEMAHKLDHADTAQKTFFQTVSHELRTPLMSIGGYAQGIERGVFPDPKPAAKVILEESERLTGMVNELLTLSRLDQDAEPVSLSSVRLADTISDALNRISGLAVKNGIQLDMQLSDSTLAVQADEALLGIALDNLLSNALRHAHTRITVLAETTRNDVQISVIDDGDGISEEDLPHLFERNYKGKNGHFGIGLSITETAIKKCKGTVEAANRSEGGAVFTITIRRNDQDKEN